MEVGRICDKKGPPHLVDDVVPPIVKLDQPSTHHVSQEPLHRLLLACANQRKARIDSRADSLGRATGAALTLHCQVDAVERWGTQER